LRVNIRSTNDFEGPFRKPALRVGDVKGIRGPYSAAGGEEDVLKSKIPLKKLIAWMVISAKLLRFKELRTGGGKKR